MASHSYAFEAAPRRAARWVIRPLPRPSARVRLVCLPYAGGSASFFRPWAERLPADVEVCGVELPGRGSRLLEPRFERIPQLTRTLADVLRDEVAHPYALFGHSLGALLAYELACRWQANGIGPVALYVSGHRAPHLRSRHPPTHDLPDDEFEAELRRLEGTPDEVLQDEELRALMLPLLRSDFALAETYQHEPGDPLECPVVAFGGSGDWVVREDEIAAWRARTRGPFRYRMLPGGHFFLHSAADLLVAELADDLARALPRVLRAR